MNRTVRYYPDSVQWFTATIGVIAVVMFTFAVWQNFRPHRPWPKPLPQNPTRVHREAAILPPRDELEPTTSNIEG